MSSNTPLSSAALRKGETTEHVIEGNQVLRKDQLAAFRIPKFHPIFKPVVVGTSARQISHL